MKGKIEITDTCLSREEILSYKNGDLSREELRRIETHLIDCPLCSDAIEGIDNLSAAELQSNLNAIEIKTEKRTNVDFNWRILISSAAAILIFVTFSIYLLTNHSHNEALFEQYYSPYPDVILHKRGFENVNKFILAMNMYDTKDYKKAIDIFNSIPKDSLNDSIIFYKALTLIELGDFNDSQNILEQNIKNKKSEFYSESLWYSSLIDIKNENYKQAEEKLEMLLKENSKDYSSKANELLSEIKGFN